MSLSDHARIHTTCSALYTTSGVRIIVSNSDLHLIKALKVELHSQPGCSLRHSSRFAKAKKKSFHLAQLASFHPPQSAYHL